MGKSGWASLFVLLKNIHKPDTAIKSPQRMRQKEHEFKASLLYIVKNLSNGNKVPTR